MITPSPTIHTIYPVCSRSLPEQFLRIKPLELPEELKKNRDNFPEQPYLADLAAVERAQFLVRTSLQDTPDDLKKIRINPRLELIQVHWQHLPEFLVNKTVLPKQGDGFVLVFRKPNHEDITTITPASEDLLALKLLAEGKTSREAAREGKVSIGSIDDLLYRACHRGILVAPPSLLTRDADFPRGQNIAQHFFSTPTFTLQWHVTQTCDLHCRHCYDRSDRTTMTLEQGVRILDDLYDFCRSHNVFTQVTFTGGNPLLYPHFNDLYREAAERGFLTAILGNPMPRHRIEEILAIQKPEFYQVSLEGLEAHNDYMRGSGHYARIFDFLDLLREMDIYSMVMLTLTRENIDQVLALAEELRDRVDLFTFNRLAMVGEGAALASAPTESFPAFLDQYMQAAMENPCMSLKDNFFNLSRHQQAMPPVGGCAGYGCGAAFNFVSLLPDGEVHACRKLPSLIGNMYEQSLGDIYHGEHAKRYRSGSSACSDCAIRPVCGGCLAVTYGFGKDIFQDIDPYCFLSPPAK